jgi:hypothetical protein
LEQFKNVFINGFYLAYFLDFRGRVYSHSIISPVGNRIFRFLYSYGQYSNDDLSNFKFKNTCLAPFIKKLFLQNNLHKNYSNINLNDDVHLHYVYTFFLEMGKIFKKKHLIRLGGKFSIFNFLEIGAQEFKTFDPHGEDFETLLEYNYVKNILTKANNNDKSQIIIYKDATASAIQLLMLVLGPASEARLEQCNLINDNY